MSKFWEQPIGNFEAAIKEHLCPRSLGIGGEPEKCTPSEDCAACWDKLTADPKPSIKEWFDEHNCPPDEFKECQLPCTQCTASSFFKMIDAGWAVR